MAVKATSTITIADISDGTNGTGIESTKVEYQAGASGTEKPTGEWSTEVPSTSASLPYLWTRVTYTYTDGRTPLEVYGVGSTPEGIEVGGRNLIRNSNTMNFEDYYFQTEPLTVENDEEGNVTVHYSILQTKNNDFGGVEASNIQVSNNGLGDVAVYSMTEESATKSAETIEMKYLTIKDKTFEIVDAKARAQATTNAAGLKVIQTRLAQFEALKEGSTTGDAELMDIRIGYDGVEHGTAGDAVRAVGEDLVALQTEYNEYVTTKAVDGLLYENNMLYLTCRGEIISEGVEIKQGSGTGGGGGGTSVLRLTNQNGTTVLSAAAGKTLELMFNFISLEDDLPTGDGTCKIIVNGATKATFSIRQGLTTVDIKDYLSVGSNTAKVTCTDVYGNYRSITYSVSVIELLLESSFNDTITYSDDITFKYTPYGLIEKTVHFFMDGNEIETTVVKSSGKQYTKVFSAMPHGVHRFEVHMTAIMDGNDIESNKLVYDIMCTETGVSTILIASPFTTTNVMQGEQISIPYSVHNPAALSTDITLTIYSMVSGSKSIYSVSEVTVDRTRQTWNTRKYPIGTAYFEIKVAGVDVSKTHQVTVAEPEIDVQPETNDLEMVLSSAGRSNNENDPAVWSYGDITTTFDHVNWDSTGWIEDENGDTALHLNGDATATIAFKPFSKDLRIHGKTIEIEFVIRDINNRKAVVIDCMSGDVGIKATADRAVLQSELASIECRYKEDVKVRVAFVIESRNENRMMSVYLNGVRSGTKQYTANDNFQQTTPVEIKIGSPYCAIDVYNIRTYDTALSPMSIRNNYIADIQDITKKVDTYENNDIYDEYNNLSYDKLKTKLPTITIVGTLPTSKGNKQNVKIIFEDPKYPFLNFTANCVIDVQGTSSQYYVRKNWKLKFPEKHQHAPNMMATKVFCLKVDYAEATGTHNTQVANYVHTLYDEPLPPQVTNPEIRSTIYGFPSVIFHQANDLASPTFYGKANFNYDKGSENVYGFTEEYDVECWEFCNNTSDVCNFKAPLPENWGDDFEARYPEDCTDTTRLAAMLQWVYDTRNNIDRFKAEFEQHFDKHYTLIYYVFTHFLLMVDQRAKNMMFTYWAATGKWYPYFYDNDTCLGINNEGQLVFDYYHEDTDQLNGANVYNGQGSVLWNNIRVAFADDIAEVYRNLRSSGKLTYDKLIECFITNGSDMWSESVYNEDSEFKYIDPLEESGDASNLYQVRGDGEMHLMYFLKNRFNYFDSKHYAQDYADDYVYLRVYTPVDTNGNPRTDLVVPACADVTLTAYSNMYAGIRYKANGTLQQQRISADETITFTAPDEKFNDTETSVYGASSLSSLGNLAALYAGSINVAKATHLVELIVGSPIEGYNNPNLIHVAVGNNKLLKKIDIQNCSGLTESLDLSGCPNIEEIYAEGSSITGIDVTKGGHVRIVHLPNTIRNLTLQNQVYIEDFKMEGYDALKTLRIENCVGVDEVTILKNATNLERVRLVGVDWHLEDVSFLKWLYNSGIAGIDETGANVDEIQVSGKCYIEALTGAEYAEIVSKWPYLEISYGTLTSYLYYMSDDGETQLHKQTIKNGGNGSDPVSAGTITAPTKESTAQYHFTFAGWSKVPGGDADDSALGNVEADRYVYAAYSKTLRSYTVRFLNYDGTVLQTTTADYGTDAKYTGSTPTNNSTGNTSDFSFIGWKPSPTNIRGDIDCYAQYCDTREITDAWVMIQKNCYSGFSSNYPIGAYKNVFINGMNLPCKFRYGAAIEYHGELHMIGGHENPREHLAWNGTSWRKVCRLTFDCANNTPIIYEDKILLTGSYYGGSQKTMFWFDGSEWSSQKDILPHSYYSDKCYTIVYRKEIHMFVVNPIKKHYKWDGSEWILVEDLSDFISVMNRPVVYNDKIYIADNDDESKGLACYDGNNWYRITELGQYGGLYAAQLAYPIVFNNVIYYLGPVNNKTSYWTWTDNSGFEFHNSRTARGYTAMACVYNDSLYILGNDDNDYKTQFYKLMPDGTFVPPGTTEIIPMEVIDHDHDEIPDDEFMFVESNIPKKPEHGVCVVHEGELYSIWANYNTEGNSYKYNASTNTWDLLCDNTPTMSQYPALISYNGELHAIGGTITASSDIQTQMRTKHSKWDGAAWTVLDTLPFSLNEPQFCCVYKDKIHVVCGSGYTQSLGHHYVYDGTSWSEIEVGWSTLHKNDYPPIKFVFVWNDILYGIGLNQYWTYTGDTWSDAIDYETGKSLTDIGQESYPQIMIYNNNVYVVHTNGDKDIVRKFDETGFTEVYNRTSTSTHWMNTLSNIVYYNYRWYAISYNAERNRKISWGEFEVDPREWVGWSAGQYNDRTNWGVYFEIGINLYYCAGGDVVKLSGNTWTDLARAGEFDSSVYGNRYDTDGNKYIYCVKDLKIYRITLSDGTVDVICEDIPYNHSPFFIDDKLHLLDTINNNHNIFDLNTNTIESGYTRTGMGYSLNGFATVHNDILYSFTDKGVYKLEKGATEWIGPYQIKGFEGKRPVQYNSNFGNPCWYNNKLYMVCEAINWGASTGNTWCVISTDLDQIIDAYIPVPGQPNLAVYKNRLYLTYGGGVNNDGTLRVFRKPKAHLTFAAKTVLNEERPFNDTGMGWFVNYTESSLRTWLNGDFYSSLPESCKSVIQPVSKYTAHVYRASAGASRRPVKHTEEKCWIPSTVEVGKSRWTDLSSLAGEGSAYSSFTDNTSRVRKDSEGVAKNWHTRSAYTGNINRTNRVNSVGSYATSNTLTTDPDSVLPCFCI